MTVIFNLHCLDEFKLLVFCRLKRLEYAYTFVVLKNCG